jgi:hypothetical protein
VPRATVKTEPQRINLKSCEGGWVDIKQLPYHEMLVRRDKGGKLFFDQESEGRVEIATLQAWARAYEFEHCIIDHNLTDENDQKLDFSNEATLSILDPRIGQEIEAAIDELHNIEEDVKDFPSPASSSSEDKESEPINSPEKAPL